MLRRFESSGVAGSLLLFATVSMCAQMAPVAAPLGGARVAGVVRDVRGVPQMGVMVELLGAGVAETALTDLQGRYVIDTRPGLYQLRASASLYLPVLRRQLRLRPGMKPIVNLTMSGLFDESVWLPVKQQSVGESAEDWKWTLKSPVNRPMLRLVEDGADAGLEDGSGHGESRAMLLAGASSGGYGGSGEHGTVSFAHQSADGKTRSSVRSGLTAMSGSSEAPLLFSALVETGANTSVQRRIAGRVVTYPQVRNASGDALSAVEFSTAERMQMGDSVALEAGNETQVLKAGDRSLIVAHPFLRVAAHPGTGWVVSYALATSPTMDSYEDVGTGRDEAPAFVSERHGASTEAGVHQELRVQRSAGRAKLQVSVHHDAQHRTAVAGLLGGSDAAGRGGMLAAGSMPGFSVDESNGAFQALVQGYSANGCSFLADVPVGKGLTLSGGYLTSVGLAVAPHSAPAFAAPKRGQAVLVSLQGRIAKTGTRVTTSYQWQPGNFVTVLSPYESGSPYLGVHVRQSVPRSALMPSGMEVTVDGSNILGEGYQHASVIAPDALLASALRELRAGIAFTF